MQKFFSKIDWVLAFRLFMAISMLIVGYQTGDSMPMVFGGFFAVYSLIASKYKMGCGYQAGCGVPRYEYKREAIKKQEEVKFTEIK